jgi:HSP20 family protein
MGRHGSGTVKFLYDDPFGEMRSRCWSPRADVYRTPTGWLVKFDLAGVDPADVQVEASRSQIRVAGVRRDHYVEKGFRHHSMEISYSRFERTVRLPSETEVWSVRTEYREGMLIVILDTDGEARG